MDIDEQIPIAKHHLGPEFDHDHGARPAKRSHVERAALTAAHAAATGPAPDADGLGEYARAPAFGPSASRTTSYQEAAAVAPELRSQLESIGMRTRFNVNRGYGSPPPSELLAMMQGQVGRAGGQSTSPLLTANDVLRNVHSTRNAWSRTRSAPLYALELQPFGGAGVRVLPGAVDETGGAVTSMGRDEGDENAAPMHSGLVEDGMETGIGLGDLKRGHDAFLEEWAHDEGAVGTSSIDHKPMCGLPSARRLSPRRQGPAAPSMTAMPSAATMPVGSRVGEYLAGAPFGTMQQSGAQSADEPWRQHDFTTFANNAEF